MLPYFRFLSKPSGNIGLYDPAEIHNRHQLSRYMTQSMVKLGFHLLFFFFYLYRFELFKHFATVYCKADTNMILLILEQSQTRARVRWCPYLTCSVFVKGHSSLIAVIFWLILIGYWAVRKYVIFNTVPILFSCVNPDILCRPIERGGEGEVFPGPATFWGPVITQKYWKGFPRWLLSDLEYA